MIERSVVEAAVQECSQSVDETMYVGKIDIFLWEGYQVLLFMGKQLAINTSTVETVVICFILIDSLHYKFDY